MRVMLVLRGAPASGKSTFIKQNKLEEFKISMDDIRVALYGYTADLNGDPSVPQEFNNRVFKIYEETLEERMQREEFLVVDNTHTKEKDLKNLKRLCKKYKYRLFIKDFTDYGDKEAYIEKLSFRNLMRDPKKRVPEDVIKRMVNNLYESKEDLSSYELINDLSEITYRKKNLDEYERIFVFGDIHGNDHALNHVLDKINDHDAIILTGDYVDRGIENDKVIDNLYQLCQKENVFMLRGNHEIWLNYHAGGEIDKIRSKVYRNYTMPQIESLPDWKKKIKTISKKLLQCFYFEYDNKDYFVTHAAIPYWNSRIINYNIVDLCKGRPNTDQNEHLWNFWNELSFESFGVSTPYQVHGHISSKDGRVKNGLVYNLNSKLEFGGYMPVLILEKGHDEVIEKVYDDFNYSVKEMNNKVISIMRSSRNIDTKKLGHNIESFNFTKETFRNRNWDKLVNKARGLFYSKDFGDVVARGYDKFFNFGELSDELEDVNTDGLNFEELLEKEKKEWIDFYRDKIVFPGKMYHKSNGFLGLISLVGDKLMFCSKSNAIFEDDEFSDDDFSMCFPRILRSLVKDKDLVKKTLQELNSSGIGHTLVFEVLDSERDPHIVEYDRPHLVLLDVFENNINEPIRLSDPERERIAKKISEQTKSLVFEVKDFNEMLEKVDFVKNEVDDYEGVVFEDATGFMFKVKSDWYTSRKRMRSKLQSRLVFLRTEKNKGNAIPLKEYSGSGSFEDYVMSLPLESLERGFLKVYKDFENSN